MGGFRDDNASRVVPSFSVGAGLLFLVRAKLSIVAPHRRQRTGTAREGRNPALQAIHLAGSGREPVGRLLARVALRNQRDDLLTDELKLSKSGGGGG